MKEEILIRPMQGGDYEKICEIFTILHKMHLRNSPDVFSELEVSLSREDFDGMRADPNGIALCAVVDDTVAGLSYTCMKPPLKNPVVKPRITAFMDDLAVHPDFQGMGVGRSLLEESKRQAVARGAVSLELMVWAFNENAVEFYEHAGMRLRSMIMEMPLEGETDELS